MAKRMVVCCDGTWNIPDRIDRGEVCPSNVAKIALGLAPEDEAGTSQLLFYDKGVGTGVGDRLRGGAVGWGLSRHIQECYRFLLERYDPGDEIFLFGFSRGAYTARSLGGFIRKAGMLKREHAARQDAAYALYRRRDDESHPTALEATLFRRSFSHEPRIRFIGVWDTVGALGIPIASLGFLNRRWQFHDVKLSSYVDHAYHAVAIDERRKWFLPTLWEQQPHAEGQVMEQVWFAGVHSNVGGGYRDTGLSDITLLWMKEKAAACGLAFDEAYFREECQPDPLGELRESKTGIYAGLADAIRPIGGAKRANETVHESAITRLQQVRRPAWRPANLVRFLNRSA